MEYLELSLWTLIGLIIGSFVNVCIDRLPLQFLKKQNRMILLKSYDTPTFLKKYIRNRSLSLFHPTRSFCFTCGHQLNWFENIPIFSYLLCKGVCRKCKAFIGQKTIWTEISHGVFYFANGFFWDSLIYALAVSICFSLFWFFVSLIIFQEILR